jgi:hypothetical protein
VTGAAEIVARLEALGTVLALGADGRIDADAPDVPEAERLLDDLAVVADDAKRLLRKRPAHPCCDCQAETEPEDLFCPACWEKRLARMPQDVAERRRRLDRVRREKRAGLIATLPHTALMATGPACGIPPGGAA